MPDISPLKEKIESMGIIPPEGFYEKAEIYAARLIEKNKVMNLTAIPEEEIIPRHFCDSVEAAALIDFPGKRVIDIGCGAGFPGMPLKILFPDIKITLLDSTAKKLGFISEVVSELGLSGVTLLASRAEEEAMKPALREGFDIALSRAVAAMPILCELCLPFVKKGGIFAAYKTKRGAEEIESGRAAAELLGGAFEKTHDYEIAPGVINRLVLVRKISQTSSAYPRKYSQIKQKPL